VERKEAFKLGYSAENTDSGFGDVWFGVHNPDVESSAAVARLVGGYRTTKTGGYDPFPKTTDTDSDMADYGGRRTAEQGELFNWEQPRIKGFYKGENAPKGSSGAILGVAALESKRRWGVEPEPDTALSPDGVRVAERLTGKKRESNYQAHFNEDDLRAYGNETSNWIVDSARGYDTGHGESKTQPLRLAEVSEGSKFYQDKLAKVRAEKPNTLNTEGINLPSLSALSRTKEFKQETLPGMDKA
jgi:hypothetical protein